MRLNNLTYIKDAATKTLTMTVDNYKTLNEERQGAGLTCPITDAEYSLREI